MNGAVPLSCFLHHDDTPSAAWTFYFVITDKSFSINDGNFFVRVSQWSTVYTVPRFCELGLISVGSSSGRPPMMAR